MVFEGGGMRGIGHVGAVHELEENGYIFRRVAGTSAGAIVAALVASGYNAREMHDIMSTVNFEKFKQPTSLFRILSLTRNFGIYSADLFEKWLEDLLAQKGVRTFQDITMPLKVTASDITERRILTLPDDLHKFGIDPKTFSIAKAVRMSMSIPLFYQPYELKDPNGKVHFIADGGLLSNYPVWLFDDGITPHDYPIFGSRFVRTRPSQSRPRPNFMNFLTQIIQTVIDDDDRFLSRLGGDAQRTIFIPVKVGCQTINSTDFDMTPEQIKDMFENGKASANAFLKTWNFETWKQEHRLNS